MVEVDNRMNEIEEEIAKAKTMGRQIIRQQWECKMIKHLNELRKYPNALEKAKELARDLKKVDDKQLLIEVHLEESRAYFHLSSLSRARSAIVSARVLSNSTFVPPTLQAELDLHLGALYTADEKDFKTAFSYFFEAFEGFDFDESCISRGRKALKYMILCKVMLNDHSFDVQTFLSAKQMIKYKGKELDAMKAVAIAAKNRSLKEFSKAFEDHKEQLYGDVLIEKHFVALHLSILENELCRLIEPYSAVDINHIATKVSMPPEAVEKKIGQMILDKKIAGNNHGIDYRLGVLDQGNGELILFNKTAADVLYEGSVTAMRILGNAVDVLYDYAAKIC